MATSPGTYAECRQRAKFLDVGWRGCSQLKEDNPKMWPFVLKRLDLFLDIQNAHTRPSSFGCFSPTEAYLGQAKRCCEAFGCLHLILGIFGIKNKG